MTVTELITKLQACRVDSVVVLVGGGVLYGIDDAFYLTVEQGERRNGFTLLIPSDETISVKDC